MRFLCCGLMSPPPERPCDDIRGLNAFSRETLSYAADFLDRPRDEIRCLGVALDLVFLGAGLLARCWMAAIMAKASMTMPAMPGSGFVVIEPELVFGCLEAVFDRPAVAFDADKC